MSMSLKVLVVDDTIIYRKLVTDVLSGMDDIEVIGTASNGKIALSRIQTLKPDLITLDIEMPEMNGLEVLEAIQRESIDVGVIVVSSLTSKGGDLTMRALSLGAFDFITKPDNGSSEENRKLIIQSLSPLIKAYGQQREIKKLLKGKFFHGFEHRAPSQRTAPSSRAGGSLKGAEIATRRPRSEVVAIGISTGGPYALSEVLPKLPADINAPVLVVQHMPPLFTQSLARSLDVKCGLKVKEAENGEQVQPNIVYLAPGGKQMKIALGADGTTKIIRVTDDPPENFCKPSVDYLFRSVAHHYLGRATGVIMTGMGNDGTLGLKLMKRNGAVIIAQDEATSVVFGMPREAIQAGIVDVVSPLDGIAGEIMGTLS